MATMKEAIARAALRQNRILDALKAEHPLPMTISELYRRHEIGDLAKRLTTITDDMKSMMGRGQVVIRGTRGRERLFGLPGAHPTKLPIVGTAKSTKKPELTIVRDPATGLAGVDLGDLIVWFEVKKP